MVEGIGGMHNFDLEGDLLLAGGLQITVFAGEKGDLPPEFQALLGTRHLRELGVSLDYVLDNPGCTLQRAIAFRRSYSPPFVSALPLDGEEKKGFDVKESFFLLSLFLGLLCLWILASNGETRGSSPASFLAVIEPQALFISLVSLALTRAFGEVCFSLSARFSRGRMSPSAPHHLTHPIQCSPSLSVRQLESLHQANNRFAHLFEDRNSAHNHLTHPIQRSPSSRAPNSKPSFSGLRRPNFRDQPCPFKPSFSGSRRANFRDQPCPFKPSFSGLRRANFRDQPCPSWKKLAARSRYIKKRHPPARRPPHKAKRVISMTKAPHFSPGPKDWVSAQPTSQPGSPLRDVSRPSSAAPHEHIFSSVPNLNFSLQRETFGQQSMVVEKLRLLSQPRSSHSAKALSPQPKRCFMMHIVRGEMSSAQARTDARRQQARLEGSSSSEPLMPRAQWMMDTPPYATNEVADRTWRQGTRTLFGDLPPLSPSSFAGGNTLKVTAQTPHPQTGAVEATIALDTQSDVTTCLRKYLSDVHQIAPDTVSGCGGSTSFNEEGRLQIFSEAQQQMVSVPALVASAHQLPVGCVALLGVSALLEMEIAVDQHLTLPQFSPLICHLGEKRLREWLIHHPNAKPDTSPFDLQQIQINPKLTPDQIAKVKAIILKFAKVFEGHDNSLPSPSPLSPLF